MKAFKAYEIYYVGSIIASMQSKVFFFISDEPCTLFIIAKVDRICFDQAGFVGFLKDFSAMLLLRYSPDSAIRLYPVLNSLEQLPRILLLTNADDYYLYPVTQYPFL